MTHKKHIEKCREILAGRAGYHPETIPEKYDQHNQKILKNQQHTTPGKGQGCAYIGGFPT